MLPDNMICEHEAREAQLQVLSAMKLPTRATPERLSVDKPQWREVIGSVEEIATEYAVSGTVPPGVIVQSKATFVDMPNGQETVTAICDSKFGVRRGTDAVSLRFGTGGSLTALCDNTYIYMVRCRSADQTLRAYRFERVRLKSTTTLQSSRIGSVKNFERLDSFCLLHVVNDSGGHKQRDDKGANLTLSNEELTAHLIELLEPTAVVSSPSEE